METKQTQKEESKMVYIDATDVVLGRMASSVAKILGDGHSVSVLNCEKAVVSGKREFTLSRAFSKRDYGGALTGPYVSRRCDRYVKNSIGGMLPRKKPSGRDAFKRLKCYVGVPSEFATVEKKSLGKLKTELTARYLTIGEICKWLGGKTA